MTALDSAILGPLFSDDEIATLLSDAALVRALVEVEIALARAEARAGVIRQTRLSRLPMLKQKRLMSLRSRKGRRVRVFPSSCWFKSCENK
jgi:adenylosuccinate lyase